MKVTKIEDYQRVAYDDVKVREAIRVVLYGASQLGVALPFSLLYRLTRKHLPGLVTGEFSRSLNGLADAGFIGFHKGLVMSGMTLKAAWDGETDS